MSPLLSLLIALLMLAPTADAGETITLFLKDGSRVTGTLSRETDTAIELIMPDGSRRSVPAGEVRDFVFGEPGADSGKDWEPGEYPGELYDEDDIPARPGGARSGVTGEDEPEPPGETPPAAPDERPPLPPAAGPPVELVLVIPEHVAADCVVCGGYGNRPCWYCNGDGTIDLAAGTEKCTHCRGGQTACKPCGGKGDAPDPARAHLCPGCSRNVTFATAPGEWACPSCHGRGTYEIIGGAKHAKCAVCKGSGVFDCVLCGGPALVTRLVPANRKAKAGDWLARCDAGEAAIRSTNLLSGDRTGSIELEIAARDLPALAPIGRRLRDMEERARALEKNMIQGSAEVREFFQTATGLVVKPLLELELEQLQIERSWVEKRPVEPER